MKGRWIAHYAEGVETEEFATLEEAKKWLEKWHADDAVEGGYNYDTVNGFDYIAKITHRSTYVVTDNRSDYPCALGVCEYCCGGDSLDCPEDCPHANPWPYSSDFETAGEIQMNEIKS